MVISEAKASRLDRLSTPGGVIAALAVDQRGSLRRMLADASGAMAEAVPDTHMSEFKSAVVKALTPHASAVLVDPEYGSEAAGMRAPGCGLLLTYEADGFENPRPHKMLALMPWLSARRLRDCGADGVKILLSYTPFDDAQANEAKHALVERIGHECAALDLPFFLEPVGYDPHGGDPRSIEYARRRPEVVIRSVEEFSKDVYQVDVLKVEFPVNLAYVEGSSCCEGRYAYTHAQAFEFFRAADAAARRPYIYLSAGVSGSQFTESLRLAAEAGARFSGVLCGRATWRDGVRAYAGEGLPGLQKWLETEGVRNIEALNECLKAATSWRVWRTGAAA